jgi:hypothetical protein
LPPQSAIGRRKPKCPCGGKVERIKAEKKKRRNKYHAKKTVVDNITFDSKREAEHYVVLKKMQEEGVIRSLERQKPFTFIYNGVKIGRYIADFVYEDVCSGEKKVQDVKSVYTAKMPLYKWKKKMMRAFFGIEIQEVVT